VKHYPTTTNDTARLLIVRSSDACTADTTQIIRINPLPVAAFSLKDSFICMPGGMASFINQSTIPGANSASLNYQWNFGDNQTSTDIQPQHQYSTAASYIVKLIATVNGNGCKDSATKVVSGFAQKPVAQFTPTDSSWCGGSAIQFNDLTAIDNTATHKWVINNIVFSNNINPIRNFATSGNYTIQLIVSDSSKCSDTVSHSYQVLAVPNVDAGQNKLVAQGTPVQLNGSTNGSYTSVRWTPPIALSSDTILQPIATPDINRLYYLTVTNSNGCSATDSVEVKILSKLFAPNAFSPNGDGINDLWNIPGLEAYPNVSVQIFNRWGQPVFSISGLFKPWNGTYNGSPLQTGTYYYIIDTHNVTAGKMQGSVTIIR
jgi:gliding motility-associated-like protein